MQTVPQHFVNTLEADLASEFAQEVRGAAFTDGAEDEHKFKFFRLWGRVVREHYNRRTTMREFHYVEGEDLELFNAYYK